MANILYIIPWFWQTSKSEWFNAIAQYAENLWYQVVFITIEWKRRTIFDYVQDSVNQFIHTQADKVSILWFSFWAMIAYDLASKITVDSLFLCSLSPYFSEDLSRIKWRRKQYLWKKRMDAFWKFYFLERAKTVNAKKLYLFVWENETKEIWRRIEDAKILLPFAEIIIVPNTKHNISSQEYLKRIDEVLII